MTRGDRIRSMTNEEMAFFVATTFDCETCPLHHKCKHRPRTCSSDCETFVANWLRAGLLRSCPFCGHDATIQHAGWRYVAQCQECNARIEQRTAKLAVKVWNTRAYDKGDDE